MRVKKPLPGEVSGRPGFSASEVSVRLTSSSFGLLLGAAVFVAGSRAGAAPRVGVVTAVDWPSFNNDVGSARYGTPKIIGKTNVRGLHVICRAAFASAEDFQSGPLAVGGVLYATSAASTFAVDGATCRTKWTQNYLPASTGGTNRGAAYANGMLFRGFPNGHVVALAAASGKIVWDVDILPPGSTAYVNAAPLVANGEVFIGTAGGDIAEVGHVVALNAANGKTMWTAQTVPNVGSTAGASWQGAAHIAGGTTWTSYTLDTVAGLLYVPTGNPAPDFYGADRLGPDLGSESVAVYDAATGVEHTEYQLIPHDVHDWDVGATPAFVRAGHEDPFAIVAAKDGYLREIDTVTGQITWKTAVTTISNQAAPIVPGGTHFCPGTKGGMVWNGPAVSKLTAFAYVGSVDWCSTLSLATAPPVYAPGQSWLGSSDGYGVSDARSTGHVTAVDIAHGTVVWTRAMPTPIVGGVTVTAGDLVLAGDLAGTVYALDDRTGAVLKTVATGAPVGGGIITYETGGKQYIAVAAGLRSAPWGTAGTRAPAQLVVLGI